MSKEEDLKQQNFIGGFHIVFVIILILLFDSKIVTYSKSGSQKWIIFLIPESFSFCNILHWLAGSVETILAKLLSLYTCTLRWLTEISETRI